MTAWLYVPACQTMEDETRYCGCLEDLDKVGCPLALMSPDIVDDLYWAIRVWLGRIIYLDQVQWEMGGDGSYTVVPLF